MSECDSGMRVTFYCHSHGAPWRTGMEHCLAAEVERLTAALADRDQRIEAALVLMWHPTEVNGCNCLAHHTANILRGESDE